MTPDKLNEMASNMESLAASDYDLYIRERDELLEAARYLRDCADAEPVACAWMKDGLMVSAFPRTPRSPDGLAFADHDGFWRSKGYSEAALYTHPQPQQAGVPEGWKLVPVEPTVEMRRAGTAANDGIVSDIYRAMLAAAPQPPSAQADAIEALRMALDALSCTGDPDDPGHRCGHCDEYVDRNAVVRKRIRAFLAEASR